jgi:Saxitoxin biosynthesis operon protein SxtJ
MAERIPARLSPGSPYSARDGRRFGFTVGAAFVVLAGLSRWRGHDIPPRVLAVIGVALVLGALVAPTQMRAVERWWMRLALAIGRVTTPIFMGAVYFLLLTPIGLIRRALGKNAIAAPRETQSFWVQRPIGARHGNLERQF